VTGFLFLKRGEKKKIEGKKKKTDLIDLLKILKIEER